jgi:hypothetical protein
VPRGTELILAALKAVLVERQALLTGPDAGAPATRECIAALTGRVAALLAQLEQLYPPAARPNEEPPPREFDDIQ